VAVTLLRHDRVLLRDHLPHHHREDIMDWTLEVVILPVGDIDRAVAFYRDKVGFELDHDTKNEHMHVVQLTPRGSGCSIVFGDLPSQNEMQPGSMKGLQLVVADAAARLVRRPGRQHLLRLRRPGRQHLGGPGAEGARPEAVDPGRGARPLRSVGCITSGDEPGRFF
jgi:catechol 2,3-dioxygenase-like lactoylglutathione lyase family enzyme